ncbi:MAG TPA: protein kinase [Candidatus Anammoximicrobium sp.]|nr:protein kinase [Candidatus Anammoximicrobium sp.]
MTDSLPPTPAASDADLTGRRLGDYHLLRRLGRGGMADVYLAEQESLGRKVAFKVLKSHLAANPSYVRRFQQEAQAAASLVHANIVQIHEVGCLDGIHFMVQEYVEGQNLKQLLDRKGTLDAPAAVSVMRQVAAALHKASQQKIIHRDIKPENIMLARSGEVKVADFGLARVEREGQAANLTQVGVTMGTPLYMSPEQLEGRAVDVRSDLYSFGVTCYQMLAGRPPFEGDSPLSIAVQHLKKDCPRLEDQRSDLPGGLCRIVHKLMAKRPEDRYQTAVDLWKDLKSLNVPGLDQTWAATDQGWTALDLGVHTAAGMEATQQLAAVMAREAAVTGRRGHAGLLLAITVLAFVLGGALAWARRPPPLLAVSDQELPSIERKATVRDQYLHAAEIATEEAWKSIAREFPPEENEQNQYYALRAQQRLAELYLQNDDLDQALRCYEQLANAETADLQFRAIGLSGQANVYILRGEQSLAHQKLAAFVQLLDRLPLEVRQVILTELQPRLRPELDRLRRD